MNVQNPKFLEKRLEIRGKIKGVVLIAHSAHEMCLEGVTKRDVALLNGVGNAIFDLNEKIAEIDNSIVTAIALFGPEAGNLRELVAYLKISNELERISVAAKKYADGIKEFFDVINNEPAIHILLLNLHKYSLATIAQAKNACIIDDESFDYEGCLKEAIVEEQKTDEFFVVMNDEISKNHIEREKLIKFYTAVKKLERSADHAVNICKLMLYAKMGGKLGEDLKLI